MLVYNEPHSITNTTFAWETKTYSDKLPWETKTYSDKLPCKTKYYRLNLPCKTKIYVQVYLFGTKRMEN